MISLKCMEVILKNLINFKFFFMSIFKFYVIIVKERVSFVSLPYNHELRGGGANRGEGLFLEPDLSRITFVDSEGISHDSDPLLNFFLACFNPRQGQLLRGEIIAQLERTKNSLKQKSLESKYFNHERYIKIRLCEYFIQVYSSPNTTFGERKRDFVDMKKTTGYKPKFFYRKNEYSDYPKRFLERADGLDIMKSVLIQACDVDSLEGSMPNTIQTSKINIYERFYNYLLMDFTIQRVPKKIYDPKLERFVDYNRSEFLMPDSELRLKEEIEAIKKHVKIKDRPKFFRK